MTTISPTLLTKARSVLKEYFGYENFRPLQAEIITSVLEKKDTLALMPTGGGKSICFQVPALCLPGTCIVVSPLIALMKDQVEALQVNGVEAAYLNSSLSSTDNRELEQRLVDGKLKLIYVSPEKVLSDGFRWIMHRIQISLFAIDEAHCVSFWGHDFRKEYTQLKSLKEEFPEVPVIALTATADRTTRKDIISQLGLHEPQVFLASFDRPNIRLNVLPGVKRIERILDFLDDRPGEPGIIYCLSRKNTEDVADKLRKRGFKAQAYHAGLDNLERQSTQEAFLKDNIQIVVATIAFGMGIDKANVRWVIHYSLPKNIESFYQEIGRAGRDGAAAETLLFYSYSDILTHKDIISRDSAPSQREMLEAKLERLKQYAEAVFCRRRILLSYFSEDISTDCGNCDNCAAPRKLIDGTLHAQKALSAVFRMEEKSTLPLLVDVLRGARTQAIVSKGYHEIKTFGAGRDVKPDEWREYIQQMMSLGLLDIAYDEGHLLKLTESSRRVLFEKEKVMLAQPQLNYVSRKETEEAAPQKPKREAVDEALFVKLKALRKQLADEKGLPPYVIFHDTTLQELAAQKPATLKAMLEISGVGQSKLDNYGDKFIDLITDFVNEQAAAGIKLKGATYLQTFELLKRGLSPEEAARERELSVTTIYSHIASLYEVGHKVDMDKYITPEETLAIGKVIKEKGADAPLKELFEALGGIYEFSKIRLALAKTGKGS